MSKELIVSRVNELLTMISSLVQEADRCEQSIKKLEAREASIKIDTQELEKDLVVLKDINSTAHQKLREKQNELDRNANILQGKLKDVELAEKRYNDLVLSLKDQKEKLESQIVLYNKKNEEINRRQNVAESLYDKADKLMQTVIAREQSSNIDEREKKVISQSKALDARAKELDLIVKNSNEVLARASEIKTKVDAETKVNADLKLRFEKQEEHLKDKTLEVEALRKDAENKLKEAEYLQLRVNKIIKEKNIADILNG